MGHTVMSTRTQLSPQITERAAGWFGKFRATELSLSEREKFFRWLRQSPEHVQAYLEEALAHSDVAPLTMCCRLISAIDEPCSSTRTPGGRDNSRP